MTIALGALVAADAEGLVLRPEDTELRIWITDLAKGGLCITRDETETATRYRLESSVRELPRAALHLPTTEKGIPV